MTQTSSSMSDRAESYHFWAVNKCMSMLKTSLFQKKMEHYKISWTFLISQLIIRLSSKICAEKIMARA